MEKMHILGRQQNILYYPFDIPFKMLSEEMAKKNHGQTLRELNSRGGMSVMEILANIKNDRIVRGIETQKDVDELNDFVNNFKDKESCREWISIKDRLPEIPQEIIIYFKNKVGYHVTTSYWDGKNFISDPDGRKETYGYDTPIFYWMSLPKPPKQ